MTDGEFLTMLTERIKTLPVTAYKITLNGVELKRLLTITGRSMHGSVGMRDRRRRMSKIQSLVEEGNNVIAARVAAKLSGDNGPCPDWPNYLDRMAYRAYTRKIK